MIFTPMGKISGFIFIFLSVFLLPDKLYGEIHLPGKVVLANDYSGGEDIKFLTAALKEIRKTIRRAGIKRSQDGLYLHTNQRSFRIIKSRRRLVCEVEGKAADWKRSFQLRRKIYGILFCTAAGLEIQGNSYSGLPVWMTAAIDDAIAENERSEKYFSGNRNHYLPDIMLHKCGTLPDFTALTLFEDEPADPLDKLYFRQFSRLLMDIFIARKSLKRALEEYNATGRADCWVKWFSSAAEAHSILSDEAGKLLWNRFAPAPPEKLAERISELEYTIVPELDENGAPKGAMKEMNFREVAQLLSSPRPDAATLRNSFAKNAFRFGSQGTFALQNHCRALAAAAAEFGTSDAAPDRYAGKLEEMKELLKKEQLRNAFVIRSQLTETPAADNIRWLLNTYNTPGSGETTAVKKILDKVSDEWLIRGL